MKDRLALAQINRQIILHTMEWGIKVYHSPNMDIV